MNNKFPEATANSGHISKEPVYSLRFFEEKGILFVFTVQVNNNNNKKF